MMQFTIYLERIWPRATCDSMINFDTKRCECKCSIILANVFAKSIGKGAYATEKIFHCWRRFRVWRELDLALKATLAKFYIVESGGSEFFLIPVKSMAMLTFNIHRTKRMTPSRFLIGFSAWR